jgi:hypothetical protein
MTTALAVQLKTYDVYHRAGSPQQKPVRIVVDPEFESRIPPSGAAEHALLETSIRESGGIRDKISVWMCDGTANLLDGHTRLNILARLGETQEEFKKIFADIRMYDTETIPDRDAALLWIAENQLSRRNLTDDQRTMVWASISAQRSKIEQARTLAKARAAKTSVLDNVSNIETPAKVHTLKAVMEESGLPERALRAAMKLEKTNPDVAARVRKGDLKLREAKKVTAVKDNRTKYSEKDYFARIGRALAVSLIDPRLTELANMNQKDVTPEAREGLANLIENLRDVEKRARSYTQRFKEILDGTK